MSFLLPPLRVLLVLASMACATTPEIPPGKVVGEPLEAREIVPLATVHADPSAYFERTVLVEGTASAVCQKSGCWMQIEDGDCRVMVRWESGCGGKYAFPPDAAGQRVLVQGSFYATELSEEDAAHLASEAPEGTTIERTGYEMNASAVLVIGLPSPGAAGF